MILSKSLVSLFAVFAAASSVAAVATPVRRGGGYPPASNPTTVNNCNGGSALCCNTFTTAVAADSALGALLTDLLLLEDPNVGLDCVSTVLGQDQCNTNTLCCQNVSQDSLVGVYCDSVNVNL